MQFNACKCWTNARKNSVTLTSIAQFDAICRKQSSNETADMWTSSDNDRAAHIESYWTPLLMLLSSVYWFAYRTMLRILLWTLLEIHFKHKQSNQQKCTQKYKTCMQTVYRQYTHVTLVSRSMYEVWISDVIWCNWSLEFALSRGSSADIFIDASWIAGLSRRNS